MIFGITKFFAKIIYKSEIFHFQPLQVQGISYYFL